MPGFQELSMQIGQALEQCLAMGYQPPLFVAAIASNGYMFYLGYDRSKKGHGLDATTLAEYISDEGVKLPVNIFVVDSKGEASRLLISPETT
jgi:hypothetical protein